jgi:hypothetical protein
VLPGLVMRDALVTGLVIVADLTCAQVDLSALRALDLVVASLAAHRMGPLHARA